MERIIDTNLQKYGYKYTSQVPEIREKMIASFYTHGTIPTSSQQLELFNIIICKYPKAELNYPFSNCSLDVFVNVNGTNIDVEYDGGFWHQDQQADIKRDKFLQSNGFKVLRVRSGHQLPTEEELFTSIDELATTDRKFKEIILSDWQQNKINEEEVSA